MRLRVGCTIVTTKISDWMVDHADLILSLWDRRKLGAICNWQAYAQFRLKRVMNIWEEWLRMRAGAFPDLYPIKSGNNYLHQIKLDL
jgi:hypothetical protein